MLYKLREGWKIEDTKPYEKVIRKYAFAVPLISNLERGYFTEVKVVGFEGTFKLMYVIQRAGLTKNSVLNIYWVNTKEGLIYADAPFTSIKNTAGFRIPENYKMPLFNGVVLDTEKVEDIIIAEYMKHKLDTL